MREASRVQRHLTQDGAGIAEGMLLAAARSPLDRGDDRGWYRRALGLAASKERMTRAQPFPFAPASSRWRREAGMTRASYGPWATMGASWALAS